MGCPAHLPLRERIPTDAEYRARHDRWQAELELDCYLRGVPFEPRPFNRREWPPYPFKSGVPRKS
jgi:hypothetical protein